MGIEDEIKRVEQDNLTIWELDRMMQQECYERAPIIGLVHGDNLDFSIEKIKEMMKGKEYTEIRMVNSTVLSDEEIKEFCERTFIKIDYLVYVKR